MIDNHRLLEQMRQRGLAQWAEQLPGQLRQVEQQRPHGDRDLWRVAVDSLPTLPATRVDLNNSRITVASAEAPDPIQQERITALLQQLHPWRKGPYQLHGIHIDTEWRSDWKWDRLSPHIAPLAGRTVLDIGCGNGYHGWRMAGAGAGLVIGIDPTQLFLAQFLAVRHFLGQQWPLHLLPLGIEDLPPDLRAFDSTFSMGVLYHRRSPIDHLLELKSTLRGGGELVLETLVIEGKEGEVLLPRGRYAKMRNVWFIPTPETLVGWMKRCGFQDVRVVDVTSTTRREQRATGWMRFESLSDYLDPGDSQRTIEGYPAPRRAILVATAT